MRTIEPSAENRSARSIAVIADVTQDIDLRELCPFGVDAGYPCAAIEVGTPGDLVVTPFGGADDGSDDVTIPSANWLAVHMKPIMAIKIKDVGTTATNIIVYWYS